VRSRHPFPPVCLPGRPHNVLLRYRSQLECGVFLLQPTRTATTSTPLPSTRTLPPRLKVYPVCCHSPVGQDCSSRRLPSFVSPACRFFLPSLPHHHRRRRPAAGLFHISPRIESQSLFSCIHSDLILLIFHLSILFANCLAAPVAVTLSGTVSFLERPDQLRHIDSPFRISFVGRFSSDGVIRHLFASPGAQTAFHRLGLRPAGTWTKPTHSFLVAFRSVLAGLDPCFQLTAQPTTFFHSITT
jgi:hypothetical protein